MDTENTIPCALCETREGVVTEIMTSSGGSAVRFLCDKCRNSEGSETAWKSLNAVRTITVGTGET